MFKNSLGGETLIEEPIFPLISFNPETNIWKCVGTGFFIQGLGGFVTAKHVFFDTRGEALPTLYAVQTTAANERHVRSVKHLVTHPYADICVGMLGDRRLASGVNAAPEVATSFTLNFEKLSIGDKIRTYAFPLSKTKELENEEFQLTFNGKWSAGEVVDFHEEGFSLVRNRCYQTTLFIDHGASGGPVLKNNLVIGINSSGIDVMSGETPISFVTPIDLILDLHVPEANNLISIKQLIDNGSIAAK